MALGSGQVTAAEALLRWHHPEHGTVMPDRFIQLAEESGLIVPIGEWVIAEATRQAVRWPGDIVVSINLSPSQIGRTDLVSCGTRALAETGLPARRLEIEVTESVFLNEANAPLSDLIALHDMGVRLALDDFGTGYSSLSYLKKLPFDRIKIDRSFIRDLPTNAQSGAIICAVVNLARSLGIDSTAEGIETAEQVSMLRAAGCGFGQGYFYGRPAPPEKLFGGRASGAAAA